MNGHEWKGLKGKGPTRKGKRLYLTTTIANMFSIFNRKRSPLPKTQPDEVPKGFLLPEPAATLLGTSRRQNLLEQIWQRTSVSRAQFADLYREPIERYAALVQQFPASESHHHAYLGGMLDHGLEIVVYALKLRQSHLLPIGAPPEVQIAQAEAWTAAVAYAALLHDVGKIAVDIHVECADELPWHPWHGPLARPYRLRYRKDRTYRLHNAAAGLLYIDILGPRVLDWLSTFQELWASLLYVLAGQYEHAGILGELVVQADQASVAEDLGGDPTKAHIAPQHALQRKLLDGLRYLVKEQLKLNQPQASDGWLTRDALWLVSKTVCDKLRAHLLSTGIDGVPDKNTAIFNVLQEHGIAQTTDEGKAIWRATVVSDTGWTHDFTFLRFSPALIWDSHERPEAFNGAVQVVELGVAETSEVIHGDMASAVTQIKTENSRTAVAAPSTEVPMASTNRTNVAGSVGGDAPADFSKTSCADSSNQPHSFGAKNSTGLQSPGALISDAPIGNQFISWLREGIQTRRLKINDAQALIHTVSDTVFLVTPGVFQRFVQENPQIAPGPRDKKIDEWAWVQKNFEKLHLHKKQDSGLNIWTCQVTGPRKSRRLYGYLLKDARTLVDQVMFDNPYLKIADAEPGIKSDVA